ncbi:MAG: hypothetical protein JXA54_12120 [Candidatus Heimdallarchaeota archaeon]|nr:hypothetical protein [Candidatus Heimdallarchaeota archaeon]
MKILGNLLIELKIDEILKLLRKSNNSKSPSDNLLSQINELIIFARKLIRPIAIYDIFPSDELTPKYIFKLSEKTILAVCSISSKLEEEIANLLKLGELSKAIILDAIASHAAEMVAEKVNEKIMEENTSLFKEKEFTKRFSPGYCKWTITDGQQLIFNLLPVDKIGVKLSNSMMMIPRKSISFAINIGKIIDDDLGTRECTSCELVNCSYRKI